MKLHANTTEGSKGLLFKKKVWLFSARLELTPEELQLVDLDPTVRKKTIATGIFGGMEIATTVNMLLKPEGLSNYQFDTLANQTSFEKELREGCAALKDHISRLGQVRSGPTTTEF
jgi:hypothetical protein